MPAAPVPAHRSRLSAADCDLDAFRELVEQPTDPAAYPRAAAVEQHVPVYDAGQLRDDAGTAAELVHALADGPGLVVLKGAFPDPAVVDRATAVFDALIAEQRASGAAAGDHFAAPGANDRVWNALEKAALRDAEAFADYYANDALALVARAWLGPGYQVTSQINVVNPGGAAQTVHRDYHLGFLSTGPPPPTRRTCTGCPRCSPSRAPSRTATCPWSRGPRCTCRTPRSTSPATWPGGCRSSGPTSRRVTCSCRWPRATRSSSAPRCSTQRVPTAPRASAAWPTCCRSPPRSAGPWRPWTGRRW